MICTCLVLHFTCLQDLQTAGNRINSLLSVTAGFSIRITDSKLGRQGAACPLEHLRQEYGSEDTEAQMDDDATSNGVSGCNQNKENGTGNLPVPGPSQAPGWACTSAMANYQDNQEAYPSDSNHPEFGDCDEMVVDVPCSGPTWETHTHEPHNDSVCLTRYHA